MNEQRLVTAGYGSKFLKDLTSPFSRENNTVVIINMGERRKTSMTSNIAPACAPLSELLSPKGYIGISIPLLALSGHSICRFWCRFGGKADMPVCTAHVCF